MDGRIHYRESGMFTADHGTKFSPFRIRIYYFQDPGSASKNFIILTPKIISKLSEIWSGLFLPNPDPDFLAIPDTWSRGQKSTRSRIRIRNTGRIRSHYTILVNCELNFRTGENTLYFILPMFTAWASRRLASSPWAGTPTIWPRSPSGLSSTPSASRQAAGRDLGVRN